MSTWIDSHKDKTVFLIKKCNNLIRVTKHCYPTQYTWHFKSIFNANQFIINSIYGW